MVISIIVAMAENRVIGRDGGLPWHLPADLAHFKRATAGHTVIMGRTTWESLKSALPGRRNIVLTRRDDYQPRNAAVAHSLGEALEMGRAEGAAEVFILGGAEVFREALPIADRLHLTLVHADVEGDVLFPKFDLSRWTLLEDRFHPADDRHEHAFSIRRYGRGSADRPPGGA
jgi:dihydrofolate reductase